jgi:hypothetical protein
MRATTVFIRGAVGHPFVTSRINGCYSPTQEKSSDGRILYSKIGDDSICIEHRLGDWEVKNVSGKGTALCFACFKGADCALEACVAPNWRVSMNEQWHHQPSVQLVSGDEAQRAVSDRFLTFNPKCSNPQKKYCTSALCT